MTLVTLGTVVLLPPAELPGQALPRWSNRRELAAELMAYGVKVLLLPEAPPVEEGIDLRTATAHWVAHNAMTLTAAHPEKPVLLVASGTAGSLLPALGFSQKASRRPVAGYVVVDGVLPKAGAADWPDAPVTYIETGAGGDSTREAAREAELRGWTVEKDPDTAAVIRALFD